MTDEQAGVESTGPPEGQHTRQAPAPPPGEPDYRMSLAAERTYLAYVRTSLALTAAGVAVVGALPDVGQEGLRRTIGVLLVALGVTVALTARHRWRAVTEAMRHGRPLPRGWVGLTLTAGMVTAGVLGLILVLRL
jgi:putative membrane protein